MPTVGMQPRRVEGPATIERSRRDLIVRSAKIAGWLASVVVAATALTKLLILGLGLEFITHARAAQAHDTLAAEARANDARVSEREAEHYQALEHRLDGLESTNIKEHAEQRQSLERIYQALISRRGVQK